MSLLDSSIAALQNAMATVDTTAQDWSQNWDNAKNDLINKAGEFTRVYNDLKSKSSVALADPALAADYQSLMSKGDYIKNTVSGITQSFDLANDWFNNTLASIKNAVGLGAIPLHLNYGEIARRSGMGFVQIVSVAVIATALSAIVYWLTDAYEMQQKLAYAKSTGATGKDLQSILNSLFGSGESIGGATKSIGLLAVGGIAIYLLWPTIKRVMR